MKGLRDTQCDQNYNTCHHQWLDELDYSHYNPYLATNKVLFVPEEAE